MDEQADHRGLRHLLAYREALLVCTLVLGFSVVSARMSPGVESIDYASVVFEGFLAVLPVAGLFQIARLRDSHQSAFWFLFAGLSVLAISMATDTLDEVVVLPGYYNTVFEGFFQVTGFVLLLLGLRAWIRWNEAMRQQLTELATTDYLTGIANRRQFMKLLHYQTLVGNRTGSPLSLIMVDLDHFKDVNDSLGHDAGDAQLVKVVKLILQRIRKTDQFARIGGEEFVLIAPSTSLEEAEMLAETLRAVIERARLSDQPHLTASFGVAEHRPGESGGALLKRTDEALYSAKASGRNCVMRAQAA